MSARFFAAATLALLFTTAGAMADVRAGAPAPDFTAMDSNGKPVSLAAFNGKTVVLEWSNHDCPYVRKHYGSGNMQALQADAAAKGVVWLTVVSSAPGSQGYVSGLEANKLTDDRKARVAAVLLDPKVSLGRSYGATATPHMFVISPTGAMVYSGAIDDKPSTNAGDVQRARNYMREAIVAAAEGKTMTPSQTRAYGCSVKYGPVPRS